jgi:hypothetical protein
VQFCVFPFEKYLRAWRQMWGWGRQWGGDLSDPCKLALSPGPASLVIPHSVLQEEGQMDEMFGAWKTPPSMGEKPQTQTTRARC